MAVPIPKTETARKELTNIMIREGCGDLVDDSNQKISELKRNLLKDADKTIEVRDEIIEMRNKLSDYYFKDFTKSGEFMIKSIDTTLGFFSHEDVNQILDQYKNLGIIASFANVVWENKIKIDVEAKCIKWWTEDFLNEYPLLKHNPTIYAWQILDTI